MLATTTFQISGATIAAVMSKALATEAWLDKALVQAMQYRPSGPWAESPRFWEESFLVRLVLKGGSRKALQVAHLDEKKVARAVAVFASTFPDVWARIAQGAARKADASMFLQFAAFGYIRFDPHARAKRK